ncbi:MAG: hypothetical protein SFU87_14470 [Chitinophagaceae bacterium]|nr:hypothetical protein [Chitinophagaceae bacterium]
MKKIFLLTVVVLFTWLAGFAQDEKPGEARLQSLEIAYITKELNLSPEEAQKFWPVYNKYAAEMREIIKNRRKDDDPLPTQQQLLDIKKKYRSEFLKVLAQERVNRLFIAEGKFRDMVRRELQQRQLQKQLQKSQRRGG